MKSILVLAAMATMVAAAQTAAGPTATATQTGTGPVMRPGGPDAATRAKLRAGMLARMGTPVKRPDIEPGICFVNAQRTVPAEAFESPMANVREEFRVSCYMRDGEFTSLKDLAAMATKTNHACVVCVVDLPDFPRVLTAPDNHWSLVNIAPLKADKPSAEKLAERFRKVAYRGFALAMGAGFSAQAGGLLQPAETLQELDAIFGKASPPDCHFPILNYCAQRKVAPGGTASYRIACKEGWAPPPKDDIQKKIWEEFHKPAGN